MMTILVECHSGYEYAQRPKALHWQGERLGIETIVTEWREPNGKRFRVLAENSQDFDLFYDVDKDEWEIKICEA